VRSSAVRERQLQRVASSLDRMQECRQHDAQYAFNVELQGFDRIRLCKDILGVTDRAIVITIKVSE